MRNLTIDVFFEFICPWCLIGKRQLQKAIHVLQQNYPDVEVILNWRGVQLLPHIPVEGIPFKAFYLQRLGTSTAVKMRQAQVRHAAQAAGVEIDFERIQRMPNTAKAHYFFKNAAKRISREQQDRLLEGIFSAYFHHSENIGEGAVLEKIASYCGIADSSILPILDEPNISFVSANTGGKGVPYFVFDGSSAMAGAQPAAVLYQAMLDALETQGQCV